MQERLSFPQPNTRRHLRQKKEVNFSKKSSNLKQKNSNDELSRILNTIIVTSHGTNNTAYKDQIKKSRENIRENKGAQKEEQSFSSEIYELTTSPTFKVIINTIRQHAELQGISEKLAAEEFVSIFRKLDALWLKYIIQEGLNHLKKFTKKKAP